MIHRLMLLDTIKVKGFLATMSDINWKLIQKQIRKMTAHAMSVGEES